LLRPTPEEVLKSISWTFDNEIRTKPADPLAVSYSLTVSNMIRHVLLCMQREEGLIVIDTAELRAVLAQAQGFLAGKGNDEMAAKRIEDALAVKPASDAPSQRARENWRALRWAVEDAIKVLRGIRDRFAKDSDYLAVRKAIRDYLDRSLNRESELIREAFTIARR